MSLDSVMAQGLSGYYRAQQSIHGAAQAITAQTTAAQPVREVSGELLAKAAPELSETQFAVGLSERRSNAASIEESLIDLRVASYNADASVNVMKTADQLIGTLINTRV